jgi:methyl-accepting chemotaxis protein
VLAGEKYYVTLAPILDYKGAKIGALLVGEPERVVVEASNNLQQQGQQTRNRILFALSLIGVLALGVSTIVQWFSAINLSKPIIKCMEFVKEVSGGNLDASLQVEGNDEIGQLAQAMHHMIRNIKSVQKGVQQEVQKDLTETVEQLASLACTMDSMSAHISEESGSMVAASKQVSDTMKAIAESASISQHNMSSVTSAAAQMSSTVMDISKNTSKAHSISEAAVGSVEKTSESMKMLNRASKDIGSVLDAIEEIADQIELLALNAKIEASRAGEAGKGFGVVANEIKELSKQANEATDEIRKKITGMQESTSNSMDSISLVSGVIREVNDIVSIIASAVEEQTVSAEYIVGNIGMASEEIKGVASSVNEAAGAADRMALGISNVGKNIDEVQKTANQLHNVTKLLNGVGQDLLKMVARFG